MKILYGILAFFLWGFIMLYATAKCNAVIPVDVQWLSTAIVVGCAMAGK